LSSPKLDQGVEAFCNRYREIENLHDPIPIARPSQRFLKNLSGHSVMPRAATPSGATYLVSRSEVWLVKWLRYFSGKSQT
jgi:hypothetical protein